MIFVRNLNALPRRNALSGRISERLRKSLPSTVEPRWRCGLDIEHRWILIFSPTRHLIPISLRGGFHIDGT
jgi:hypothetical protein